MSTFVKQIMYFLYSKVIKECNTVGVIFFFTFWIEINMYLIWLLGRTYRTFVIISLSFYLIYLIIYL